MKNFIILFLFILHSPVISHESSIYLSNKDKCFKRVYKEKYIPGDSLNSGYVKRWEEDIKISCDKNHNHPTRKVEKQDSGVESKKCNGTLGSLIGGGLAASLSTVDAYGWSIPLGLVLGKGIANSGC